MENTKNKTFSVMLDPRTPKDFEIMSRVSENLHNIKTTIWPIYGPNLSGIYLIPESNKKHIIVKEIILYKAFMQQSDFSKTTFKSVKFDCCLATSSDFTGCRFIDCYFDKFAAEQSVFVDCVFDNCNFNKSIFNRSNLTGTIILNNCKITKDTDFSLCRRSAADHNIPGWVIRIKDNMNQGEMHKNAVWLYMYDPEWYVINKEKQEKYLEEFDLKNNPVFANHVKIVKETLEEIL